MQKLEKRRPQRQEERKVSSCWNKSCLVHNKNFDTESNTNTNPLNETRFNKKKGRVYKIWFSDIRLTQHAVTKFDFLHDTLPWNVIRHDENLSFGVDFASYPIAFMPHDCITYDINMTLLWWMGVANSRYQYISSSWDFSSIVTSWFVSNIVNTSIWI